MRIPRVAAISMIVLTIADVAPADNVWSQTAGGGVPGRALACAPLETREPNVPDQRPAFPGQTRACAIESNVAFDVVVLAQGLGGDELNLIEKGKNYGWPRVAYGEEYSGEPIPGAVTARPGYEQPLYYWDPVIAPSGAQFYMGDAFPAWRGSLLTGSLTDKKLVRLILENGRVTGEEHLLRQGPDGALYLVTDEANGELWKIAPRK